MIGIGINIAADFLRITSQQGGEEPPAFDIDVQSWLDLITDKPSAIQNDYVNTMISDMKDGLGVERMSDWADVFYHLAAETAEASLKNLVKDAHHAVAVNSPTFTPLEGWQGDGISSYIDTNYNPRNDVVNASQNNISIIHYCRNNSEILNDFTYGASISFGASPYNGSFFIPRQTSTVGRADVSLVRGHSSENFSNQDHDGAFAVTRNNSTVRNVYKNKLLLSTAGSYRSTSLVNLTYKLLALDNNGTMMGFSEDQLSLYIVSKYLDQSGVNVITDEFEALMDKNGKGVIE